MSIIDMRVSSPLESGGAWDPAPSQKPLSGQRTVATLWCAYAEGAPGGAAAVRAEASPDGVNWYTLTLIDAALTVSPPYAAVRAYGVEFQLPPGTGTYALVVGLPPGMLWLRTPCAEVGVPGTPGTLAVQLTEGP